MIDQGIQGERDFGAQEERSRIREKLLSGFADLIQSHPKWRGHATLAKTVRDLINRVCEE